MDDLVSREWMLKNLFFEVDKELVSKAPSAKKHGRWTYEYYTSIWYGRGDPPEWVCSVCHDRAYNNHDYCPNCGAMMDGGVNDE